jgi:uncharacterized DUF497 family protein
MYFNVVLIILFCYAPKPLRWDPKKNQLLTAKRRISFDAIEAAIVEGQLLNVLEHPNKERYPNQRIFVVRIEDYVFLVPFVENEESIFLKTIYPSLKATKD